MSLISLLPDNRIDLTCFFRLRHSTTRSSALSGIRRRTPSSTLLCTLLSLDLTCLYRWGETDGIPNEAIDHSPEAILIAQYTADFFVQQTRRNEHRFASTEQQFAALIDNYTPAKNSQSSSFVQSYYLPNSFVAL